MTITKFSAFVVTVNPYEKTLTSIPFEGAHHVYFHNNNSRWNICGNLADGTTFSFFKRKKNDGKWYMRKSVPGVHISQMMMSMAAH